MTEETISYEEKEKRLPTAEAYHVGGRQMAVDCPICGRMEHAPNIGEPGGLKECEYMAKQGVKKEYKVVKKGLGEV